MSELDRILIWCATTVIEFLMRYMFGQLMSTPSLLVISLRNEMVKVKQWPTTPEMDKVPRNPY